MRFRWSKLGTQAVLVGYLLSTLSAPFLHDHTHSHALECATCCEKSVSATPSAHADCKHSHSTFRHAHKVPAEQSHAPSAPHHDHSQQRHPHHHLPWHDDDCSACQYFSLAQWSAATVSVAIVLDVVAPAVEQIVAEPRSGALLTPQARGPPQAA